MLKVSVVGGYLLGARNCSKYQNQIDVNINKHDVVIKSELKI